MRQMGSFHWLLNQRAPSEKPAASYDSMIICGKDWQSIYGPLSILISLEAKDWPYTTYQTFHGDSSWLAVQKVANCHGPDGSLFFIACIEQNDNELLALETAWGSQSCVLPRSERIMRSHQFRGTPQTNLIKGESSSKYSCPGNKLFCI